MVASLQGSEMKGNLRVPPTHLPLPPPETWTNRAHPPTWSPGQRWGGISSPVSHCGNRGPDQPKSLPLAPAGLPVRQLIWEYGLFCISFDLLQGFWDPPGASPRPSSSLDSKKTDSNEGNRMGCSHHCGAPASPPPPESFLSPSPSPPSRSEHLGISSSKYQILSPWGQGGWTGEKVGSKTLTLWHPWIEWENGVEKRKKKAEEGESCSIKLGGGSGWASQRRDLSEEWKEAREQ